MSSQSTSNSFSVTHASNSANQGAMAAIHVNNQESPATACARCRCGGGGRWMERGWSASDRSGGRGKRTGSKSRVQSPDCSSGSDAMALDVGEAPALIRPLRAPIV
jgi:hypothetical protein